MAQDLAVKFNCHLSTVSRKIITWAFLHFDLGSIDIWPIKKQIQEKNATILYVFIPFYRSQIDSSEIRTEQPSSRALWPKCYSSYKSSYN